MKETAQKRSSFIVKDLVINVGNGGGGDAFIPADDTTPVPTPITPIASIVIDLHLQEAVRAVLAEANDGEGLRSLARAFDGEVEASPTIAKLIESSGRAAVAGAVLAAAGRGGEVGLVDPDTTFWTVPTSITPIVSVAVSALQVHQLPLIKRRLAAAYAAVEQVEAGLAPRGKEMKPVTARLEDALANVENQ